MVEGLKESTLANFCRFFEVEKELFAVEPACVAGELAIGPQNAMTGDDD